jgi:hypothetical protein
MFSSKIEYQAFFDLNNKYNSVISIRTTLYRNVTKRSTRSDTSNTQLKIEDEFKSLLPIETFNT